MNCKNCKKEIDSDSKFCEFCGSKAKEKDYAKFVRRILKKAPSENANKTLRELNENVWYRALKVAYFFTYLFLIWLAFYNIYGDEIIIVLIEIAIGMELVRRAFYYIIFGTIKPEK